MEKTLRSLVGSITHRGQIPLFQPTFTIWNRHSQHTPRTHHSPPPGDLVITSDATPDPHCGGWGAIQYYYHFRPDSGAIPLLELQTATHPLPPHFKEDLLAFEHWPAVDTLLTFEDPDPTEPCRSCQFPARNHKPSAFFDDGITFCSGPARTTRAYSHGPSLAQADWHRIISDTSGYWKGDHCHTLGVGCIAEAFHLTTHLWPELSIDTVTLDQFTLPVTSAFATHTSQAQACLHSWRFKTKGTTYRCTYDAKNFKTSNPREDWFPAFQLQ